MAEEDESKDPLNDEDDSFHINEEDEEYLLSEDLESFNFEDEDFQFGDDDDEEVDYSGGEQQGSAAMLSLSALIERVKQGDVKDLLMPGLFALVAVAIIGFGFTKLSSILGGINQDPQFAQQLNDSPQSEQPSNLTPEQKVATTTSDQDTPRSPTTLPEPVSSKIILSGSKPASTPSDIQNQQVQLLKTMQEMAQKLDERIQQLDAQAATINERISGLEQKSAENTSHINSLSHGISNIQNDVEGLNNSITGLLAAVKSQQTSRPPQALYPTQNNQQPVSMPKGPQKSNYVNDTPERFQQSQRVSYFVQAIIPGRAWLKDSEGRIISVTKNDMVPGFGTVVSIDPRNGFVTTSSGVKLEYGIEQF